MKTIYSFIILLLSVLSLNAQVLDRSIRPSSAPAKEINIKDAQIFTLSNGLKVFLVEDKTAQIVYYSMQVDVEPVLEGDKAGLSSMLADVIGKATVSRTKEQLNRDIDMIGARANIHTNGGYISFLKKYEPQALEVFSDMLLHPVFSPEEFTLTLDKYNTFMQSLGDDAGQLNQRISNVLTYGKGYLDGEIETKESINNIQLDDLKAYYDTYFAPNVSRLVIVGDVSLKEAKANAKKYFGAWKKKKVPVAKYTIPEKPENVKVAFVVKPGAVQSVIDVSYPIPYQIGDADYDAARIMNYILGGSATGYLFTNLREKHSYTYGVYSKLSPDKHIGRFNLGAASVKAAATDSSIYEVFTELNRIITEPVTEEALKAAKTYLAGSFSRSLEQPSSIANFATQIDKYKLPKDYFKNYLKRLDAITVEDVQKAAVKYIHPANAWIVVAGDQAHANKLLQFASDNEIHYFDFNANPIEAPVAPAFDTTVEKIIAKYMDAVGGQAAIEKIDDMTMKAEISLMGQTVEQNQLFKKPNLSLIEMRIGTTLIQRLVFDGNVLKTSGMRGEQEFTSGPEFENMKSESAPVPEMDYIANGYTLAIIGIEEVNGRDAYMVSIEKEGANASVSYFDKETGLKVRTVSTSDTAIGEQKTTIEYDDYREVKGVKFPFAMTQNTAGMTIEMNVISIEINTGLSEAVFQ